jgi:hypothetical protein
MAKYRLKRKTFGVVEAAGNVLGNTAGGLMKGVGTIADSKIGRIAGGVIGAKTLGHTIGALTGMPLLGTIGGYIAGKAITGGVGSGLKEAGQSLQDRSA